MALYDAGGKLWRHGWPPTGPASTGSDGKMIHFPATDGMLAADVLFVLIMAIFLGVLFFFVRVIMQEASHGRVVASLRAPPALTQAGN